jgi:hypothetical protein
MDTDSARSGRSRIVSEEEVDRSALEAEAQVLSERELLSLISADSGVGALPDPESEGVDADQASDANGTPADRSEQSSEGGAD